MTALEQALLKLDRTLANNGIPYMIIGGMANAVWGEPRATLDIDVTVWVAKEDISHIVSVLAKMAKMESSKSFETAFKIEESQLLSVLCLS